MVFCWQHNSGSCCSAGMYCAFADYRANGEFLGGTCIDIPVKTSATEDLPFKGNMDLERLKQ